MLALARIKSRKAPSARYFYTARGDGLLAIKAPQTVWMYPPSTSEKNLLKPSLEGINEEADIRRVLLKKINYSSDGGWVEFQEESLKQFDSLDLLMGQWICIEKRVLVNDKESIYFFEILGCSVKEDRNSKTVGVVRDFFENGAHGVIVVKLVTGEECLIPFIKNFVELHLEEHFLIVKQLEYFIV